MSLVCRRCGVSKPDDEFPVDKRNGRRRRRSSWCRECHNAYARARYKPSESKKAANRRYYERNKMSVRERQLGSRLQTRYGITIEDYEALLAEQDGRCAICGTDKSGGRSDRFHVDHDHETGEVRGLLCLRCNLRLAVLENEEWMGSALAYLAAKKVLA